MNRAAWLTLVASVALLAVFGAGLMAWTVCLTACATAGMALLHDRQTMRVRVASTRPAIPLSGPCLLVLAFLFLTLLPVPLALTRATGSERYAQNALAAQALAEAAALDIAPATAPAFAFTRNRAGTLRAAALCAACFAVAFLVSRLPATHRRELLRALCGLGALVAILGWASLRRIPQGDTLWWHIPVPHGLPGPVACFINRNHFAGFLAMLAPAAAFMFADDISARRPIPALFSLLTLAAMAFAALVTHSRGGMLALATAALVVLVVILRRREWKIAALTVALAALAILATARFSSPAFRERAASLLRPTQTLSAQTRLDAWRDSLTIWRHYPLAGAGANAFRMVYPYHRTTTRGALMTHPENQYVALLTDAGLAGFALLALTLLSGLRAARLAPSADPPWPLLRAAAAGALAVAAVHATLDFALHVPLVAVTLAAVAGAALPPPSRSPSHPAPDAPPRRFRLPTSLEAPWTAPASCLLAGLILFQLSHAMRHLDSPDYLADAPPAQAAHALAWAPTSAYAWLLLGHHALASTHPDATHSGALFLTRAAQYDPNNYRIWHYLGHIRLSIGDPQGAREAFARAKALRDWLDIPPIPEGAP